MDCCSVACWRHFCPPCSGDVLRDCSAWLWPLASGCICIQVTARSERELLPQLLCTTLSVPRWSLGWEMGQSPGLAGASVLLHLGEQQGFPPPAVLRAASVISWSLMADGWCRLTSFLLEGLPFPPASFSPVLLSSLSPGCRGLCWSRMGSSACSGHKNPACTHGMMGGAVAGDCRKGARGPSPG